MALHLNLYHEVQTQSLQRKRDPLRLGMLVILFVATGFVGYYFYRLGDAATLNSKAARLQSEWQSLGPKQTAAAEREKELRITAKLNTALMSKIEDRCLWGTILDMVAQSVPPEVQLKTLEANKPLQFERSTQLGFTVSGIAGGPEGRRAAEDFRVAFQRKLASKFKNVNSIPKDGFKSLEDRDDKVVLNGQTYPTAAFVISYEATIDNGQATPASAPSTRPRKN